MNRAEALRSIRHEWLEYIQKKVRVEFDKVMQLPVCFTFKGEKHRVHRVLGRFRTRKTGRMNAFLIHAESGEIYFLYFQQCNIIRTGPLNVGFWVLSFRVLSDRELMAFYREDRKMLVNMTLKKIIDFHGHLCPELTIGAKACEYAQKLLFGDRDPEGGISIVAENCTSALDAIQVLLGATAGNQRLKIMDFGKHNYTFSFKNGQKSFRLSLKHRRYGDEDEYERLEEKILKNRVTLNEVVYFQKLLDNRVKQLLDLSPEDLFDLEHIRTTPSPTEMAAVYFPCCCCEQQVLKSRTIDFKGKVYCIPCFQRMNTGCRHYSLQ